MAMFLVFFERGNSLLHPADPQENIRIDHDPHCGKLFGDRSDVLMGIGSKGDLFSTIGHAGKLHSSTSLYDRFVPPAAVYKRPSRQQIERLQRSKSPTFKYN